MEYGAVVAEIDWVGIRTFEANHWGEQGLTEQDKDHRRKTVIRSIRAWALRYPKVHWWLMPSKRAAEIWCFRLLERFWMENMKEAQS